MKKCTVCGADHYAKGVCKIHYRFPVKDKAKISRSKPLKLKTKVTQGKSIESLSQLLDRTETVFNKWVKERDTYYDRSAKCISCQKWFPAKIMDAGHYKSKKFAPVRFNEDNVFLQCLTCNRMKDGNEREYRKHLIELIGIERVEIVEQLSGTSYKWDREYLLSLIDKYGKP